MTETEFWQVIGAARQAAGADLSRQLAEMETALAALEPDDLIDFAVHFNGFRRRAYRGTVWDAAYVTMGGCSDDAFDYFRAWLITQGEAAYTSVLAEPDRLVEWIPEGEDDPMLELEEVLYLPKTVYERRQGLGEDESDFDERVAERQGPSLGPPELADAFRIWNGDEEDDAAIREHYPRLYTRFWEPLLEDS